MRDDRPSLDLPSIEPGQIWLIEHDPGEAFCRFDGAVLGQANVVLYDRALAPLVAQALPIGAYAEPLPGAAPAAGPAIAPRALDFAAEGWIVVQLVAASPAWRVRLPIVPSALSQVRRDGALPVRVITKAAGDRHHEIQASLGDLAELVREAGADERLSIVFGPFLAHYPLQARAFTANGLAG